MSIKNAYSSIFGRLRIYDIEKITIFAATLRIRGNAEVRPPNVKGTVMQTRQRRLRGSTSCSRFFYLSYLRKSYVSISRNADYISSADGLRKTPHV